MVVFYLHGWSYWVVDAIRTYKDITLKSVLLLHRLIQSGQVHFVLLVLSSMPPVIAYIPTLSWHVDHLMFVISCVYFIWFSYRLSPMKIYNAAVVSRHKSNMNRSRETLSQGDKLQWHHDMLDALMTILTQKRDCFHVCRKMVYLQAHTLHVHLCTSSSCKANWHGHVLMMVKRHARFA